MTDDNITLRQVHAAAYSAASARGFGHRDAEDAAQEGVLAAIEAGIATVDNPHAFGRVVGRNKSIAAQRRIGRVDAAPDEVLHRYLPAATDPDPMELEDATDQMRILMDFADDKLSINQHYTFYAYLEAQADDTITLGDVKRRIADDLGVTVSTVETHIARAREKLRGEHARMKAGDDQAGTES